MKRNVFRSIFFFGLLVSVSCNTDSKHNKITSETTVDTIKRNRLVKKYELLKYPDVKQPVLLTIDEFFDGNSDEASIAPNLTQKPGISEFYKILKNLSDHSKTEASFAEIKEVMIYDGQLDSKEWFYTDIIYFIGDLTKEEIKNATLSLQPTEVGYATTKRIAGLHEKFKTKKIVYIWWD